MAFSFPRFGRRTLLAAVIAAGGSAVPVVVPAAFADVAPATIIVVDVQAILSDSKAAVGVQKQLDSERNNFQKEISAQEGKLRTGEQELARQRTILSADAFEQKRRDFEKQVADVQRIAQTRRRALDQAFNDSIGIIKNQMLEIVADVATEQGAKLVLTKSQVVLVEKSLDVTNTVMERLDKKLPSVAVSVPKN